MWAYTGENILSALPSKNFPCVISHMVLKGGVQGFKKKMTTKMLKHKLENYSSISTWKINFFAQILRTHHLS